MGQIPSERFQEPCGTAFPADIGLNSACETAALPCAAVPDSHLSQILSRLRCFRGISRCVVEPDAVNDAASGANRGSQSDVFAIDCPAFFCIKQTERKENKFDHAGDEGFRKRYFGGISFHDLRLCYKISYLFADCLSVFSKLIASISTNVEECKSF